MTAKKDTKLTEKPTRMPETREEVWHEIISHYLEQVRSLNSESARSHRFGMVVQKLLDFEPGFIENYVTGIEKYVKVRQKDRILKGKRNMIRDHLKNFQIPLGKRPFILFLPQQDHAQEFSAVGDRKSMRFISDALEEMKRF